jgi:hypothetical protein
MSTEAIATRTVSAFPLSIGTSLAFESVFQGSMTPYDPTRIIPEHIDISNYKLMVINIETLLRNIINAVDKTLTSTLNNEELADTIANEIDIINSIFLNEGRDVCKTFYYYNTHSIIKLKNGPLVKIRNPKTKIQEALDSKIHGSLKIFFKKYKDIQCGQFSDLISPPNMVSALIFTHYPYDLLSHVKFTKLDLLESFTGKLKDRKLWYTKFYSLGDIDLSYIPFLKKLLIIFGDHVLFSPWIFAARKEIIEVAKKGKWTYTTTETKVLLDMEVYSKDLFLIHAIKNM